MTITFYAPASWTGTTNPTVTITSFSAGDEVIVVGLNEDGSAGSLATPTATGLTFSLVTNIGGATASGAWLWRATAAGSGGSTVITSVQTGGVQCGLAAWVRSGTAPSTITLTGTHTNAAFSQAVAAGDDVIVAYSDFNALAAGRTQSTGSGTPVERVDSASLNYGQWAGDWTNCSAGTFSFGVTSYTGLAVAQVGIVLKAPSGSATATPDPIVRGVRRSKRTIHGFFALERNGPLTPIPTPQPEVVSIRSKRFRTRAQTTEPLRNAAVQAVVATPTPKPVIVSQRSARLRSRANTIIERNGPLTPIPTPKPIVVAQRNTAFRTRGNTVTTRNPKDPQRFIIPAYFYPAVGFGIQYWEYMFANAPSVYGAIANPATGPGSTVDPNYAAIIARAQALGIKIFGYVDTNFGAIASATVTGQVDTWFTLYGIRDIFFDNVATAPASIAYYTTISNYVHNAAAGAKVIFNHGTNPDEGYIPLADILCNFEGTSTTYSTFAFASYVTKYPPSKFWHLVYNALGVTDMQAVIDRSRAQNAKYVYVTEDTAAVTPWDTTATYFNAEQRYAIDNVITFNATPKPTVVTTRAVRPRARSFVPKVNGPLTPIATPQPIVIGKRVVRPRSSYLAIHNGQVAIVAPSFPTPKPIVVSSRSTRPRSAFRLIHNGQLTPISTPKPIVVSQRAVRPRSRLVKLTGAPFTPVVFTSTPKPIVVTSRAVRPRSFFEVIHNGPLTPIASPQPKVVNRTAYSRFRSKITTTVRNPASPAPISTPQPIVVNRTAKARFRSNVVIERNPFGLINYVATPKPKVFGGKAHVPARVHGARLLVRSKVIVVGALVPTIARYKIVAKTGPKYVTFVERNHVHTHMYNQRHITFNESNAAIMDN